MQEKISIIVPVYNGEKYLKKTIQNLLNSIYQNIEIILIDDGSKDNSLNICKKMQNSSDKIQVFHQENQGIVAARNQGLRLATGQYICFCDQDDIVLEDTYQKMYDAILYNNADLVMCSTAKYAGNSVIPFETYNDAVVEKNAILDEFVIPLYFDDYKLGNEQKNKKGTIGGSIWKCMICRKLIEENNVQFKRFINFEDDYIFLLEILSYCSRVVTLNHIGYYWRMNQGSETYRWKYISDLEKKEIKYYTYLKQMLERFNATEYIREEFRKRYMCTVFVNLIDNEGSPNNSRKVREKITYLKENIYTNDFEKIIKGYDNFVFGFLKKKIILKLLSCKMIRAAYYFNIFYRRVRKIGIRFKLWSINEKRLRAKNRTV